MSHIALARKWRPQRFEDVIGQRGVVETLKNAIASDRLAQSFIFAGPRGVGKTTTARILARALNCVTGPTAEPCGTCDACTEIAEGRDMDVLEIDGATYTGVDAVREVIVEPLSIAPMRDRFKIFIIDEVHRLSKNAFDALLKSIEEPPPYVKFMMATTELQAVPATIQSRSQVFELKTLPFGAIRDQLRAVTTREGVEIEEAALALVARSAEGSMRDALSALDQVLAFTTEKVTTADVSTVIGLVRRDVLCDVIDTVVREDLAGVFHLAGTIVEAGHDLRVVCRELARLVRDLMVIKIDPTRVDDPEIAGEGERERLLALAQRMSREDVMRSFDLLSKAEFEIKGSSQPRHHFEMTLVKWIHLRQLTPLTDVIAGLEGGGPIAGFAPKAGGPASAPGATAGRLAPAPGATAGKRVSILGATAGRPSTPHPAPSTSHRAPAPAPASAPGATAGKPSTPHQVPSTAHRAPAPAPSTPHPAPASAPSASAGGPSTDLKSALLAAIREGNKTFFGMYVAQAQSITADDSSVTFTFAPAHKSLAAQFEARRGWLEQLAQGVGGGRKVAIVVKEGTPVQAPAELGPAAARQAELVARAKAEPTVQAMLDVFGGEIQDVEEIS